MSRLLPPTAILLLAGTLLVSTGCAGGATPAAPPTTPPAPPAVVLDPAAWEEKVTGIRWVAYSPTQANPEANIPPNEQGVRDDIALLRRAGFTGLVTYGSTGVLGTSLPALAQSAGFEGLVMGVWDPANEEELANAEAAAKLPVVLGVCVGNEGLGERYQMDALAAAVTRLQQSTGKPVTTTEQIEDYADQALLGLGDWVFPNVHPYFNGRAEPGAAVQWTRAAYGDVAARAGRFVLFKEVGLPTAGDPASGVSEQNQERYYRELSGTEVRFVYFEAFDQPWKDHLPVEPHWGIFRADRTPKSLATSLLAAAPPGPAETG